MQNNLNRWYDSAVGRWMSEDPIGYRGDDFNLYRYVDGDPLSNVDPSGEAIAKGASRPGATKKQGWGPWIKEWWDTACTSIFGSDTKGSEVVSIDKKGISCVILGTPYITLDKKGRVGKILGYGSNSAGSHSWFAASRYPTGESSAGDFLLRRRLFGVFGTDGPVVQGSGRGDLGLLTTL